MTTGIVVLLVALIAATVLGIVHRRGNGRFRETAVTPEVAPDQNQTPVEESADDVLTADDLHAELGDRATLLQFSSAFCAPCRATRVLLADIAGKVPGVSHVELDAESNLELVRRLDIRRTPTVLVLDHAGRIAVRASGLPKKAAVLSALQSVLEVPIESVQEA
ncbi:TlpA family protein disulfide reductase [Flindersiella endophytica]